MNSRAFFQCFTFSVLFVTFCLGNLAAQQWGGSATVNGNIFRNGNVGIGPGVNAPASLLSIGANGNAQNKAHILNNNTVNNTNSTGLFVQSNTPTSAFANTTIGIMGTTPSGTGYTYGVYGSSYRTTAVASGRSYGVYGTAGNGSSGYNYGVFGNLAGSSNGAAILGLDLTTPTTTSWNGNTNGKWAGYFVGNLGVTNRLGINNNAPAHRLDVFDNANANSVITKFADAQGRRIFFVPKLGAGGFTFSALADDAGIFWSDNSGFNTNAGLVIAPQNNDWTGIRLAADGKATMPGYNATVGTGLSRLGLGKAEGAGLGFGTGYISFNGIRSKAGGFWDFTHDGANNGGNVIYGDVGGSMRFVTEPSTGAVNKTLTDADILNRTKMTIRTDGKVTIGGNNTNAPGNYLLYVRNGILTEEVKVAVYNSSNWADYVFDEGYDLPKLEDVETFIENNGHLPNVPSAEEIVENGGFELKKMSVTQQEKIEEIFLYLIDMNKKIKALESENADLKASLQTLKKQ